MINQIVRRLTPRQKEIVKTTVSKMRWLIQIPLRLYGRWIMTPLNLRKNRDQVERKLEIGPGPRRIEGFETVNVVWGKDVDYIADAARELPFPDSIFSLVYASHVLEHIPWFRIEDALKEWVRVIEPGGHIELWLPDGLKLCQFIIDIESGLEREEWLDDWRPFNAEANPYKWANGRLLYGVRSDYPSWHTAIVTPSFLASLLGQAGLVDIESMDESQVRGVKHGWINLGMRGRKP